MIEDVKVINLVIHEDNQGCLIEISCHADAPESHGVIYQFGQVYL